MGRENYKDWKKVVVTTNRLEGYVAGDELYPEPNDNHDDIYSKKDEQTWSFSSKEILRNPQWFDIFVKLEVLQKDLKFAYEGIDVLCKLIDEALDPIAKNKLKGIVNLSTVEHRRKVVLEVLDLCVHGSLCSGMTVGILETIYWKMGGTPEEFENRKTPN